MTKDRNSVAVFNCLLPKVGTVQTLVKYREEILERYEELMSENDQDEKSENAEAGMLQQLIHWLGD